MKLYIEPRDLMMVTVDRQADNEIHVLVTNAACIGARWPLLAKYKNEVYEWAHNDTLPREYTHVMYGHGVYKKAVDQTQELGYNSLILND